MKDSKALFLAILCSGSMLMANLYTHEPTGWGYDQTTEQAFYIFDEVDILFNGVEIIGEGDGNNFENSSCQSNGNCDVVGAFLVHRKQRDGFGNTIDDDMTYAKCNQIGGNVPQDWFIQDDNGDYTGEIEGCQLCIGITYYGLETTAIAMGISANDADEKLHYYATPGDSIEFKFYDASEGSVLELTIDSSSTGVAQDDNLFNDQNPAPLLSEYGLDRWVSNTVFTYHGSGNELIFAAIGDINGCTDSNACNYDSTASVDDGSCQYAEENFDCNGDCTVVVDCGGVCGGDAFYDNCNQCMCGTLYGPDQSECDDDDECEQGCDDEWYSDLDELPEVDECGVCDGPGIVDGTCDCDGNVLDCNDECGGTAIEDACGECGGDGSTCGENSNDINTPYAFEVSSIYPNPFNPSTTISYTLSNVGITNIKVLDMDGREIQVLLNNIQSPGAYQLIWNPHSNLSSGNYFIHLQSSSELIIKKVTYIK